MEKVAMDSEGFLDAKQIEELKKLIEEMRQR
jgi:hypothetical protein